jgi:mannose-6-phosphate isomerase class I
LKKTKLSKEWRKTGQFLLPERKPFIPGGKYDIYPSFKLDDDQIAEGFKQLAEYISRYEIVVIDGYAGVFYDFFRESLDACLKEMGITASWKTTSAFLKPQDVIEGMISPFTGGDDPVFGKRCDLNLEDFFDITRLKELKPDPAAGVNILTGPGASLSGWEGLLVYIDIPKNELQFRARAGSITNLGASEAADPKAMYKRFYFVDWVVLNKHKQKLLPEIDLIIDGQSPENPVWMSAALLRNSLYLMSRSFVRVRPWFEPGVWGGTWIKDHIEGLNKNEPNYAWSFELIVPENGILLESSGIMLEVSFDCLMYQEAEAVLGDCYDRFNTNFPIRFDFLDTFDGGNLSVQCHPRPGYIKEHFGEDFTQEETYYILDTKENAVVYLGFNDDIDQAVFRNDLEKSFVESKPLNIEKYVQKHIASKHDLFLIPYGTIHGSGINNLVLEISSTPYIFTFKMYDWVRADLDGKPRPLNIGRGMENLYFERKGEYVKDNLISKPVIIKEGNGWQIWHLPTHETHLYDIHRYVFSKSIEAETGNQCHVLSLVEGESILVETQNGFSQVFSYAETFFIPAAAGAYRITNHSKGEAIVVKAFVKNSSSHAG